MTRAASGAQRSGAAAPIIIFARSREDYDDVRHYFASSFFAPRTPARWERKRLWAGSGRRSPAGSPVPIGSGGGTANRLKSLGSTVPFYGPSRDACTGTSAHAYARTFQNHRTTEPTSRNEGNQPFLTAGAVLVRFCRSAADIKWGGYSLLAFAGSASADQGLDGGSARRKFRRRVRLAAGAAGAIGAAGEVASATDVDRAISTGYGRSIGRVGTAVLEGRANVVADQCLAASRRKPARLPGQVAVDLGEAGGVDAGGEGGTPPSAARLVPSMSALPIFCGSIDLRIRCHAGYPAKSEGRLTSSVQMGSGDCRLPPRIVDQRRSAIVRTQDRVGVQRKTSSWGRSRELTTLWGAPDRVN